MPQRVSFNQLFTFATDGSLELIHTIKIGAIQLGPGVRFTKGVSFAGIDFFQFLGRDFQVEKHGNVWEIVGIYNI